MISVCMATYNGEAYIEKQLCSILFQTCKADEVILCDDGSTDQTVLLMQRFIEKFDLKDEWKLVQNPEKKGYPGNFYYAMSLCRGDYVFLADQDDIWDERKLEHMSRALEEHPDAAVVSCKFGLIDAQGEILHTMLLPVRSKESGKERKEQSICAAGRSSTADGDDAAASAVSASTTAAANAVSASATAAANAGATTAAGTADNGAELH